MKSCLYQILSMPEIVRIIDEYGGSNHYGMTLLDILVMFDIFLVGNINLTNQTISIHGIREIIMKPNPIQSLEWISREYSSCLQDWYPYITVIFMELVEIGSRYYPMRHYQNIINWLRHTFKKSQTKWETHYLRALHYSLEIGNTYFADILYLYLDTSRPITIPRQTLKFVEERNHVNSLQWIKNHLCLEG